MLIKGVEIFAVGSWNGLSFSEKDIDGIVNSFVALGLEGRVPLKLSHDGPDSRVELESKYALGWVKRVWREDDILMADIDVPDKVFGAIKDGYLKFVSVELLKDVRADTRKIPWVLDAVALLGADQPAVGILKDLQSVLHKRGAEHVSRSFASVARFSKQDNNRGEKLTMTPEEILKMQSDLAASKAQNVELVTKLTAEQTARVTFEKNTLKAKADEIRKIVETKFNEAIEQKRILPFVRENFEKYQTPVKENDEAWAGFDAKTVDKAIEANTLVGWKAPKGTVTNMNREGGGRTEVGVFDMADDVDEGKSAGETFQARFDRVALENKVDLKDIGAYDKTMKVVMSRYPKLAQLRHWEPEAQKKQMGGNE